MNKEDYASPEVILLDERTVHAVEQYLAACLEVQ